MIKKINKRLHLNSTTIEKISFLRQDKNGSIISVVGKTTVEIIELFKCTQKVP